MVRWILSQVNWLMSSSGRKEFGVGLSLGSQKEGEKTERNWCSLNPPLGAVICVSSVKGKCWNDRKLRLRRVLCIRRDTAGCRAWMAVQPCWTFLTHEYTPHSLSYFWDSSTHADLLPPFSPDHLYQAILFMFWLSTWVTTTGNSFLTLQMRRAPSFSFCNSHGCYYLPLSGI